MKRRALGIELPPVDVGPYLAVDLAGDDGSPPERLNIIVTDDQLAGLLPAIVARLRERLKGP